MTILKKKRYSKPEEKPESSHSLNVSTIQPHSQIRDSSLEERRNTRRSSSPLEPIVEEPSGTPVRWSKTSPIRQSRCNKYRQRNLQAKPGSSHSLSTSPNSSPKPGPSTASDFARDEDYNSEDEYFNNKTQFTEAEWIERDKTFEKRMGKRGLIVKQMKEDGACLFRAISDQVYGDQEMHDVVRKHCMDYITANRDYYSQYMTEDFNTYIDRKRQDRTHGNHIEIQAMCEMYNRPIEVFCYGKDPINIFHGARMTENANEPIRLSYQRGSHYNSIVDPCKATIGVGLGLPNLSPGSADRNLVRDAIHQSEEQHIEQTMLEDKIRATDWEATNEAIEEQVARESYLQWYKENEGRKKNAAQKSPSWIATSSANMADDSNEHASTTIAAGCSQTTNTTNNNYPSNEFHATSNSPRDFQINETASFLNQFSPEMFGLTEWEDVDILTQVLATSQEEYLNSLKRKRGETEDGNAET